MARKKKRARSARKRPTAKQLAARAKFAAMARARARAARKSTPTRKRRSKVMAAKRRRTRKARPMRSVRRKGGGAVTRQAWKASGFRRNPRRRRVARRRYRRNPSIQGIGNQVLALGKQTVAVMAGRTLGRTISGMIPFGSANPLLNAGKGVAVAIGVKMLGRRFLSADLADALAVGAMIGPVTDLVSTYLPGATPFLSGGPIGMPTFPGAMASYPRLASYPQAGDDAGDAEGMGSYAEVYQQ